MVPFRAALSSSCSCVGDTGDNARGADRDARLATAMARARSRHGATDEKPWTQLLSSSERNHDVACQARG